ncbi:MAG: cytidine deaminase [Bacteroidota bacterium]
MQYGFTYTQYDNVSELDAKFARLIQFAKEASEKAYAPYSSFYVGAAILGDDQSIVTGNNQENASYPVGTCAERVALNYYQSQHRGSSIEAIAIYAHSNEFEMNKPVSPCGMCRQALLEAEKNQSSFIRLFLSSRSGKVFEIQSVSDLLPLAFGPGDLKML